MEEERQKKWRQTETEREGKVEIGDGARGTRREEQEKFFYRINKFA